MFHLPYEREQFEKTVTKDFCDEHKTEFLIPYYFNFLLQMLSNYLMINLIIAIVILQYALNIF